MSDLFSKSLRGAALCRIHSNRRERETKHHRRTRCRLPRRGAATLEFAIVSPVIFLMVLSSVQFAGLLMSQNLLTAAAREGGRVASMPSTLSDASVVAAVQDRLSRGGLNPGLISVDVDAPADWVDLNSGDKLTVSVSGAMTDLSWITFVNILPSADLSAEITYERE